MSTMLKTAAMTLLSKTLQTFLYKYLSDVDVEGVALPSVYDGSGWGVRLSNVKLRDGVQLMEKLPGKLKRKRKKKKKKKKKKTKITTTKEQQQQQQQYEDDYKERSFHPQQQQRQRQGENEDLEDPTTPKRSSYYRSNPSKGYYSDDDEDEYGDHGPSTPEQSTKSIFSCFHNSRAAAAATTAAHESSTTKNYNQQQKEQEQEQDRERHFSPPSIPDITIQDKTISTKHPPPTRVESELTFENESFSNRDGTTTIDSLVYKIDAALDDDTIKENENDDFDDYDVEYDNDDVHKKYGENNNRDNDNDEDDDDDDEYEEYEQPVKLCLGENGRIGILDIRLIGKELHVLVEDAVLTIEAIPIPDDEKDENDNSNDNEHNNQDNTNSANNDAGETDGNINHHQHENESTSAAGPPQVQAKSTEKKKKKKPADKSTPKRVTVGDRVLADNPLARAISAIPHLFLRDIRIRFIIRNNLPEDGDKGDGGGETNNHSTYNTRSGSQGSTLGANIDENDCMFEIGIEFLSVTSGEDVLSHFQQQDDDSVDASDHSSVRQPPMSSIHSFSSVDNTLDQNEYLIRHIRTGRGPTAGLSVQLYTPGRPMNPWDGHAHVIWARQQWMLATEFYLFRCSGLDIRARIPLGTKKEVEHYSWFYGEGNGEETMYDEHTLDSLIFGIDHVAPGPQLPLPPMSPHMSRGDTPMAKGDGNKNNDDDDDYDDDDKFHASGNNNDRKNALGADSFFTDCNGIQSCHIPSSFHRVSRGMLPASGKNCNHLPSQTCQNCWDAPHGVKKTSELDNSIPMPGLALQVTLRDPLEINIDRKSLEALGTMKSLFLKTPPPSESSPEQSTEEEEEESDSEQPTQNEEEATQTTSSTSYFGSILARKVKEPIKEVVEPSDAFAKYMQPENVQVMGVHLSEIRFRIHVMSESKNDNGLSFCYWDIISKCLTIDHQSMKSKEKTFQDLKFDVGYVTWDEYRGTDQSEILSLGLPYPERRRADSAASYVSVATVAESAEQRRTPWPSTACALMDVPPPLESIIYKSRERHGVQIRFVSVENLRAPELPAQSYANIRLGVMSLNSSWGFWRNFGTIRRQSMICITGVDTEVDENANADSNSKVNNSDNKDEEKSENNNNSTTSKSAQVPKSVMKYKFQIDGGSMTLDPVMSMKMPLTQFCGERSTDTGISMETILEKFQFAYGSNAPMDVGQLDVQKVAALPENVRMRIFLFLDDLGPLEQAFQVKPESNSFKRCRALNKGILKMAKKLRKARLRLSRSDTITSTTSNNTTTATTTTTTTTSTYRRQDIMKDFMRLSDSELNELWMLHQKQKRKAAKRRNAQS